LISNPRSGSSPLVAARRAVLGSGVLISRSVVRLVAARHRSSRSARIWGVDFEVRGPARRRSSRSAGIWSVDFKVRGPARRRSSRSARIWGVDFEIRGPARRRSSPLVAQC